MHADASDRARSRTVSSRLPIDRLAIACRRWRAGRRKFARAAMAENFIRLVERRIFLRRQFALERRHLRARRKRRVAEMVIRAPAVVGDDLAGFLKRNRRVIIAALGNGVHDRRPREWSLLAGKITRERQIHRGLGSTVEIDAHVPLLRRGGPDAPDAARAVHFGQHEFAVFLADDAVVVAVRIPMNVFAGGFVVTARAVIAGKLRGLFSRRRQRGQMFQIGQALDEVNVGQNQVGGFRAER